MILNFFSVTCSEISLLIERQKVDRRHIEDAYFQYALLTTQAMYPGDFRLSDLSMHHNTPTTLIKFTAAYHEAFIKRYSGTYFKHELIYHCFIYRTQMQQASLWECTSNGWQYEKSQECLLCI